MHSIAIYTWLLFLLIITTNSVLGKSNKTSPNTDNQRKLNFAKVTNERLKRSISNDNDIPFWPNRGKKQMDDDSINNFKYDDDAEYNKQLDKSYYKLDKDEPFWGNRGRRDSSIESSYEYEYPEFSLKHCEHCVEVPIKPNDIKINKQRREYSLSPFWGSRGKKNSLDDEDITDPFWGNRGRRHEKEPFWGNRGRRTENEPFWGNRGRRDDVEPFWGNRGRRDNAEPFWGNRGKRQDSVPFWGNRGRRKDEPFWANRGRREASERYWPQNRKEEQKYSISNAFNEVENNIDNRSRLKKNDNKPSFWANRARDNKLSSLFNNPTRTRPLQQKSVRSFRGSTFEPGTVLDNKLYVDEPSFILVERTGRSSDEDDPFYISRGKKYYLNYSLEQATRDRRGAIEEIVKSMRNDPYYIARGKKELAQQNGNSTLLKEDSKAKDLICAAIELITIKKDKDGNRVKREISDNERDRRTTLKKLAAQLQVDPYFVSRGKKSDVINNYDNLRDFISDISEKCN